MIKSPASLLDEVVVGNDAAWIAEFCTVSAEGVIGGSVLTRGRDDYYASVEATLPHELAGGRYRLVIENMTDDDYAKIADKQAPVVRLYLFWRDNNQSLAGYAANVAGVGDMLSGVSNTPDESTLVAVLGITTIARKKGALTYDVEIEAREWVYDHLSRQQLGEADVDPAETNKRFVPYIKSLVERRHLTVEDHEFAGAAHIVGGQPQGKPVLETLNSIAQRIRLESRKFGRGIFLIRDGKLVVGDRPFPLVSDNTKKLTIQGGLIEINKLADFENDSEESPRRQYQVLLKGRPDIKPGGVVRLVPPEHEDKRTLTGKLGLLGEIASSVASSVTGGLVDSISAFDDANAVALYVMSVTHQLSKTAGFSTTLTGVEFDPATPWDTMTPAAEESGATDQPGAGTTGEDRLASAISSQARTALQQKRHADIGQVRAHTASGDDPHRHTTSVWRGTTLDGGPHESVRNAFEQGRVSRFNEIPIVSPFAWGKCGLVLPRYPGTRVVLVHRNGELSDALDIGAVWEWDSGNTGPDAEPGDYWLALPAEVPAGQRERIEDGDSPLTYNGKVSQDLIDADGNRVIEVGELTVRVGDMQNAGTRPARPGDAHSVTIEHVSGESMIVMRQDGTIVIKGQNIEIDAGSGDITMKANNVNVQVGTAMDVTSG